MAFPLVRTAVPTAPPARTDTARLRDEFGKQYQQLDREKWARLPATALAFAAGLVFLPAWIVLPLAAMNLGLDLFCSWLLRDGERLIASRPRRAMMKAGVFLLELVFVIPAGIMWHMDDPFAMSLAVGLAATGMMHISTVRSIHLPHGLWGAAGLGLTTLTANSTYWIPQQDWTALGFTTLLLLASHGYFLIAMVTNYRVHSESTDGHRAAQLAVAAKDRLLATISHELRTPLNGILGMGHAELAGATTPEAKARLSVLVASAEGLSVILDDILDISAARDGRLAIHPVQGVPADEIAATVLLFRHGIADKGVAMTLEMSPDLSQPAHFDPQRLRQCLSNLLSNALRHAQGAAVRIHAAHERAPDGQHRLHVTVADDGPGVPETLRDVLFEPFARFHNPVRHQAQRGHGLGLSIARSLARQMGGDLVLEPSGPRGQGAVFRLTVDLIPAPESAPVAAAQASPAAHPLAGTRVLVVDDIATNRLVAASCLTIAGVETEVADSGAAALDKLAAGRFDGVFLDMNMPDLDGLATLARIRALPGPAARVAVIAMTADAGAAKRALYLEAGCDGYLAKPVTPERIAAALSSTLAARQAGMA